MRKVTMRSLHGQTDLDIGDIGMNLVDGETVLLTDAQYPLAMRNPNIVDTALGYNPNFQCVTCGKATYVTALHDRRAVTLTQGSHTSTLVDGKRYCEDCLPAALAPSQPPEVNDAETTAHVVDRSADDVEA